MISKKTASAQAVTGTEKPAARRVATKKPVTRAALPATGQSPAGGKVAAKKTAPVKPTGGTRIAAPAGKAPQVSAVSAATTAVTLTEASNMVRKPRPVRDSFTMSEAEYTLLGELKQACLEADYEVKKSELVRVGIALVARLDLVALKDLLAALETVKPGRAKKA
ncbi:MAG: hypothetical protein H7234_03520 [Herminiimonas sp.]|nr:hypothetical protein [Herminiimonas sp.]